MVMSSRLFSSERGGILLRVLIAVITLVIIGAAIFVVLHKYQQKQEVYHRKATAISEYGLLVALQKIQNEPSWSGDFGKTAYDDGWYRVETSQYLSSDTLFLTIKSFGHMNSVLDTRECKLRLQSSDGDSVWVRYSMH